jgi:hypothetical protein
VSLVLIPVKVRATRANGTFVVGATVRAVLTVAETDDGLVVPDNIVGVTDAAGEVTLNLWPNSRGVNGSQYRVEVTGPSLYFSGLISLPEAPSTAWPVELSTLINQPPYPSRTAAELAQLKAQEYMLEAKGARDEALAASGKVASYAELRLYNGTANAVRVTGYLVTTAPSGTVGSFTRDDSDTTSLDNNGTVIIDALGRRWKRNYRNALHLKWFEAVGNFTADDTTPINNWLTALSSTYHKRGVVDPGRYKHTSPITWSNYRNLVIDGSGGNFGDSAQIGATFEFVGDPVAHASGGVFFTSVLDVTCQSVGFINRTNGINYHVVVGANDTPALSTHMVDFKGCTFGCGSGLAVAQAGVLVANAKLVKFLGGTSDYRGDRDFRFGLNASESPNTLMTGAAANCAISGMLVFGDVDLRNVEGMSIKGNAFEDRTASGGAASVTVSGDERTVGVKIQGNHFQQDRSVGTDTRPAIDTGSYAGTASLAPAGGWDIEGNTFRDRATNINIARGGVRVGPNVHQLRNRINAGISIGINIEATVPADAAIEISPANDFSMADTNNLIPIVDNRVALADQVVFSAELGVDTPLAASGSYQTVITGNTIRPLRGGKYRLTYHADILSSGAGGGFYRVEALIAGAEYGTRSRITIDNSEQGSAAASRIVKLAGTTGTVTIVLRIFQETAAAVATIRGAAALGSTFVQLEEMP